jgi:ABC-type lipoprotein release transport system permease subunit
MKLLLFALKNALRSWWRTIIFGIFIFLISFITIFVGSFSFTIQNQMEDAIINGLSGHIQIRSGSAENDDFAEQLKSRWKGASYLSAEQQKAIEDIFASRHDEVTITPRVRHGGLFISDKDKTTSLIIGLDPLATNYQDALILVDGRMLDPNNSHEIVITESLAKKLQVGVGSEIGVLSRTKDGYTTDAAVKVAGIVQYRMLSLFSFSAVYTDLATARELIGYTHDEVSDIILFLTDKNKTQELYTELLPAFRQTGMTVVGEEAKPISGEGVKLSTYKSMGGFFMGIVSGFILVFYVLIILMLLVVSILISNLIFMMGIERYKEIGTLRAIGFSKFKTIRIFMTEIFCVTGFFGLLGILSGTALNLYFSIAGMPSPSPATDFIMGKSLLFRIDYPQILITLGLLFGFTFLASFFPAYKACSLRPVEILKDT